MIKNILSKFPFLYNGISKFLKILSRFRHRHDALILSKSHNLLITKDFIGGGNIIEVGSGTRGRLFIRIRGYNNRILIGDKIHFGVGCSLWIEGNNSEITIGSATTMTEKVHINCQEDGRRISLGEDCMLSNNIIIRTSDSHPIFDCKDGCRLNPAKDVVIGNHVWIAPNSKIMKGAIIRDGAIVGSDTTVTKEVEPNTLVIGRPQKIVKRNIYWTRDALF